MNKTKKFLVLLKLTVRWSETVNGKYNLEIIKYVLNKDIFFGNIHILRQTVSHQGCGQGSLWCGGNTWEGSSPVHLQAAAEVADWA